MEAVDIASSIGRMAGADGLASAELPVCRPVGGGSVPHALEVTGQQARAIAARLGLPHTGFLLQRSRLQGVAAPVLRGGVLSLVAGPGCGKTAFIMDLLSSAEGRSIYLALDEGDQDPVRFLGYLMASMGAQEPRRHAEGETEWLGLESPDGELSTHLEALMNAVRAQDGERTLLAIDDLHHVHSSSPIQLALELLLRGLPGGWTLILSSRREPPLQLERIAPGGRLVRIDGRSLRLTPSEIGRWTSDNWGIELASADARGLWRITQGWPAALVLLGQRLIATGRPVTRNDVAGVIARGRDLRTYLKRDILAGLSLCATQVMLTAGLLPRLVLPRDQVVFDHRPGIVKEQMEDLVSKGFLVTRMGRASYVVHPLVRAFAERELVNHANGHVVVERVAKHLESVGEHYHSARLYLRIGRLEDANRSLRALALRSPNAAAGFARDEWTGLMAGTEIEGAGCGPWLLLGEAWALQQQAEYRGASRLYERSARLLAAEGDREGLLLVLLNSAFCLYTLARWEESLAVLSRCKGLAVLPEEQAEVLVAEGNVLVSLCRWDEGVEAWEKAILLAPEERRASLICRVHLGRGRLFHLLGHYRMARQWADKALYAVGGRGTATRAMALHGAALTACLTGDYVTAEQRAADCRRLTQTRRLTFLEVPGLLVQADSSLGRWDYRTAINLCREAQRLAAKSGDAEGSYWAEQMLGDLCRCNRNAERGLSHHREAFDVARANSLAVSESARAQAGQGMDLVLLGRDSEARGMLEEAIQASRKHGLKASLVSALFYLGWLEAKEGREHEASRCLTESTRTAEEHDHTHFFCTEARVALPILALCDRYGVGSFLRKRVVPLLPAHAQEYFHWLAEGDTYPTDVPLGPPRASRALTAGRMRADEHDGDENLIGARIGKLTEREREILKAIAAGMPNKVIGARLFISEKTVKTHANHIFRKLGVSNRLQATLMFQSHLRAVAAGTALRTRRR